MGMPGSCPSEPAPHSERLRPSPHHTAVLEEIAGLWHGPALRPDGPTRLRAGLRGLHLGGVWVAAVACQRTGFARTERLIRRRDPQAFHVLCMRRGRATFDVGGTAPGSEPGIWCWWTVPVRGGVVWAVVAARPGHLSVGDIAIFIAAVAGVQGSLTAVAGHVASSHEALMLFEHYLDVVHCAPDLPVAAAPVPLPALREGVEFKDVRFRYSDEHPWVLRGVSFRLRHGEALALVGLNGSGKSTLVKLLCRFYDPTHGAILWDGVDLRDVDPARLRTRIGAAFQDYMAYGMTAAENIGLGDLDAFDDAERIRGAARRAGTDRELSTLPRRYDTLLSRRFPTMSEDGEPATGVVLSGGRWQRLALARACLRDERDLMILDEPASGLDAQAEAEIQEALRTHRRGRTSLLISHRLGSVREADVIVVLAAGQVVERGSHKALMSSGGEYARLFALQASGYRAEDSRPGVEEAGLR
ncbi:ATP-binding cassette domain-containing protein [Streptomyces triculaminicus]|uniref:ATP-binding cassette domain-containing protein n=1 Tax=Streptomyces triculaminicus TaxID=2816232 RepID=A0A939FMS6_9ACTN|nr:ATP-binding cassette domain-containing protein [Streptomyces triculaminicus]